MLHQIRLNLHSALAYFHKRLIRESLMAKSVVEIQVRAVIPTKAGSAVFLGNSSKTFVIYIDGGVAQAILMFMQRMAKTRPLTHDLMAHILAALGAKVERVIINDLRDGTYFARLILSAENELHERKIIEIDARPSDCLALAVQQSAPIYVAQEVWSEVEDVTEAFEQLQRNSEAGEEDPGE